MSIVENYNGIKTEINDVATEPVTLVAVSKTKPISDIYLLYNIGVRDFGENKVQEFLEKYDALPKDINWHFIGHLQTNKVKYLIGKTFLIHSVDSIKLATIIDRLSEKNNIVTNILVQINLSYDSNKFGIDPKDTYNFLYKLSKLKHIKVMGIMLIPKIELNYNQLSLLFSEFKALSIDIINKNIDNIDMDHLSFGMSDDYLLAIKNGSNMVRVGSKIFGSRKYT